MQATENLPVLRCDNVLVSARGITEAHGNKVMIFVPAAEIERMTLRLGRSDYHPIVTLTIGIVLSVLGVVGLVGLVVAPVLFRYELGLALFLMLGGSLIFDGLKVRYFLEVYVKRGTRRVVFSKNARRKDIQDFCEKVAAVYKHQIVDATQGNAR